MNETKLKAFGKVIQRLIDRQNLTADETYAMFREVLSGEQPDLQQGAFLAALVAKSETVDEISGAWRAIQEFDTVAAVAPLPSQRCENSGTGMDSLKTFNVSSAAAIIAAACGVTMTRHGARALTSFCGTVDILESVGVDVNCPVTVVSHSIREAGIGLFNGMSPQVHPAALGRILSQIRFGSTLNIAASLANPARPTHAVRGVYNENLLNTVTEVMLAIGYQRGMVVHGQDRLHAGGMDEISVTGPTLIREFAAGSTPTTYQLNPEELGLKCAPFEAIATTGDLITERRRFLRTLAGQENGACEDFACINAAAILQVTGHVHSLRQGLATSRECLASGAALAKLRDWTRSQAGENHPGQDLLAQALLDANINTQAL
jgi:anthranilate phosphoribosyltransferase